MSLYPITHDTIQQTKNILLIRISKISKTQKIPKIKTSNIIKTDTTGCSHVAKSN